MTRRKESAWEPIEIELVRDGFVARVTRTLYVNATRWRWSVTPIEVAQRWRTKVVEHAHARGYATGRERAMRMAEVAIDAFRKAGSAGPADVLKAITDTIDVLGSTR